MMSQKPFYRDFQIAFEETSIDYEIDLLIYLVIFFFLKIDLLIYFCFCSCVVDFGLARDPWRMNDLFDDHDQCPIADFDPGRDYDLDFDRDFYLYCDCDSDFFYRVISNESVSMRCGIDIGLETLIASDLVAFLLRQPVVAHSFQDSPMACL